jgi:enamine deaminase RidA (YjgF/YER057c/UK114 family)
MRVGDRVWVSGTGPVWADGSCSDDAGEQTRRCFDIIGAALSEAGGTVEDVVRTRMFLTAAADADAVSSVHGEIFSQIRPAATMVVVAALLDPRWKIEIEVDALIRPDH